LSREIRAYDYINHPYAQVRGVLTADPEGVLRAATSAAASRARTVAASLRVEVGGVQVGTEIATAIGKIEESGSGTGIVTRIPIEWQAAHQAHLFPLMSAVLSLYPLTSTETQLDFHGRYDPPLGLVGVAIDSMVGHRIAEASVHTFIADVAHYLRTNMP